MENYKREKTSIHDGVNPFLSVWYEPRVATRYVVEHKTYVFALILAIISGILTFSSDSIVDNAVYSISSELKYLFSIVGGAIGGIIGWIVGSFFMMLFGKLFGGTATFKEMAIAMSMTYFSAIIIGLTGLLDMLVRGSSTMNLEASFAVGTIIWLIFSVFLKIVLSVWGTVISIKAIS